MNYSNRSVSTDENAVSFYKHTFSIRKYTLSIRNHMQSYSEYINGFYRQFKFQFFMIFTFMNISKKELIK